MFHTTKDGRKLPISEMDNEHLLNTVRRQKRRAKEGVKVFYGYLASGDGASDNFCETDIFYGRDALELFNHQDYLDEVKKRGLTI
jgi:hypothetical protein